MSTLRSFAAVVLLAAAGVAVTTPTRGAERVSLRVSPGVSFAPGDVTVNAIVEPDAANRTIDVLVESDAYLRRSQSELEGNRAARSNQFRFAGLPAGTYQIRVAVKGASGKELGSAAAEVRVIGDETRW